MRAQIYILALSLIVCHSVHLQADDRLEKIWEAGLFVDNANLQDASLAYNANTKSVFVAARPATAFTQGVMMPAIWSLNPLGLIEKIGQQGALIGSLSKATLPGKSNSIVELLNKSKGIHLLSEAGHAIAIAKDVHESYSLNWLDGDMVARSKAMFGASRTIILKKTISLNNNHILAIGSENAVILLSEFDEIGQKAWERSIGSNVQYRVNDISATSTNCPVVIKSFDSQSIFPSLKSKLRVEAYDESGNQTAFVELDGSNGTVIPDSDGGLWCIYTKGDLNEQHIICCHFNKTLETIFSREVLTGSVYWLPFIMRPTSHGGFILACSANTGIFLGLMDDKTHLERSYDGPYIYGHSIIHDVLSVDDKIYVLTTAFGGPRKQPSGSGTGLICFQLQHK